jgi:hypothetical protein
VLDTAAFTSTLSADSLLGGWRRAAPSARSRTSKGGDSSVERGGHPVRQRDLILESLSRAYFLERDGATEIRGEVTDDLDTALGSVRAAGAAASVATRGRPTYRGTPDYLGLRYDPMLSLRDLAEGVPFIVLAPRRRP